MAERDRPFPQTVEGDRGDPARAAGSRSGITSRPLNPSQVPGSPSAIDLGAFPSLLEVLAVFVVALTVSVLVGIWLAPVAPLRVLVSYATHIPMLLIPLLWCRIRLRPFLGPEQPSLLGWHRQGATAFVVIAVVLVTLNLADELLTASAAAPEWVRGGVVSIALTLVFQGVVVGPAEEMLIRVGVHLPLKRRWADRGPVPWALIVAALAFGIMHLPNILLGQPLGPAIAQAGVATVLGLVIGYYFQKTENYLGSALLHGAFNTAGAIGILLGNH
jgi:membrane protease YdiL (CAAX protease family)